MAQVRIKLLHNSSHPDASGKIGEEINCCEHIARRFIEGKGAEIVAGYPVKESPAPKSPIVKKRPLVKKKVKKSDGD